MIGIHGRETARGHAHRRVHAQKTLLQDRPAVVCGTWARARSLRRLPRVPQVLLPQAADHPERRGTPSQRHRFRAPPGGGVGFSPQMRARRSGAVLADRGRAPGREARGADENGDAQHVRRISTNDLDQAVSAEDLDGVGAQGSPEVAQSGQRLPNAGPGGLGLSRRPAARRAARFSGVVSGDRFSRVLDDSPASAIPHR